MLLVLLLGNTAGALPSPSDYLLLSDGGQYFGETIRLRGDLSWSGLDDDSRRPARVLWDDVRFYDVIKGEFLTDYIMTEKYDIIETEPGDDFDGREGYHLLPFDEQVIKGWVEAMQGNPDWAWARLQEEQAAGSRQFYTVYALISQIYVNWAEVVRYAGGGPVVEEKRVGDGISQANLQWTYSVTRPPDILYLGLAEDKEAAEDTDHLRVTFQTHGIHFGSDPREYPTRRLELKINNKILDLRDYPAGFSAVSNNSTEFNHDIPIRDIANYLEPGPNKVSLYVEDTVMRTASAEYTLHYLIEPTPPDFYTRLEGGPSQVDPGGNYSGRVIYGLKSTVDGPRTATLTLVIDADRQTLPLGNIPGTLTLQPGEEVVFDFSFRGPQQTDVLIESEIWPVDGNDANPADNYASLHIPTTRRESHNPPDGRSPLCRECRDIAYTNRAGVPIRPRESKEEASWDVTYRWIDRYEPRPDRPIRDDEGNIIGWKSRPPRPVWESATVTYNEAASMQVEVVPWNVRSLWELEPVFGKAASKALRAGGGFEVNVVTKYVTDWETKVPVSHDADGRPVAIGGTLTNSPGRVWACFPYANWRKSVDPNDFKNVIKGDYRLAAGQVVELELVDVKKKTDQEMILYWRLPEQRYQAETKEYRARFHPVDKWVLDMYPNTYLARAQKVRGDELGPRAEHDDRYRFYVIYEADNSKHGLYVIQEHEVYIFGTVFDDVYITRPSS